MVALFSLLIIVSVSILVIRIGAAALELTGLPYDVASFQAQSAFSGAGFTTSEAETIVNHPVRRKICQVLIFAGSAGLTSAIATLVLTFIGQSSQSMLLRFGILAIGLLVIFLLARSELLHQLLKRIIMKMLRKNKALRLLDYQEVLGLRKGYIISRFQVKESSWMVGSTLAELDIRSEGILVFSILRKEEGEERFVGVPTADTTIKAGDVLICYGKSDAIKNLSNREKGHEGDEEHHEEVRKEKGREEERKRSGGYS